MVRAAALFALAALLLVACDDVLGIEQHTLIRVGGDGGDLDGGGLDGTTGRATDAGPFLDGASSSSGSGSSSGGLTIGD